MFNVVFSIDTKRDVNLEDAFDFFEKYCLLRANESKETLRYFLDKVAEASIGKRKHIRLMVSKSSHTKFYDIEKVISIESNGKKKILNSEKDKFDFYSTMDVLEEGLNGLGFCRINRSFLISLDHVSEVLVDEVILSDGSRLEVARKYYKQFHEALRNTGHKI